MVPIGCLGMAATLTYGLYCFHRGHSQCSQLMMCTQITTQGSMVSAVLLGLAASAMKSRSCTHDRALKAPQRSFQNSGATSSPAKRLISAPPVTGPCVVEGESGSCNLRIFFRNPRFSLLWV
jgi:hypothetical protein